MLVLVSCTVQEPVPKKVIPDVSEPAQGSYISGALYVKISDNASVNPDSPEYRQLVSSIGEASIRRLFPDEGIYEQRHRLAGLDKWYVIEYDPGLPRTKVEADFSSLPGVELVETPYKIKQMGNRFDDPFFGSQWSLLNDGSVTASAAGCDINVLPVWDRFTTGSSQVVVGVVDGGVQEDHPDLQGIVLPPGMGGSRNFTGKDFVLDYDNHGTHVAGVIAAINNNSEGICGIAGGSDGTGGVRIMSCQIFTNDRKMAGEADLPRAFVWAADNGVTILNNSWGYDIAGSASAMPASLKTAIDYFIDYAGTDESGQVQTGPMKGGVVIFAAGNEGWQYGVPASYSRVIAVASVSPRFSPADYSNYGPWVDICAPGGMMYSPFPKEGGIFSSILTTSSDTGYEYYEGTSMACPHVTGVAALILSYYGGPGFTNEDLKARLLYGANYNAVSSKNRYVGPLLDAYGAMTYERENDKPILSVTNKDYDLYGVVIKSYEKGVINIAVANGASGKYPYLECSSSSLNCRFDSYGNIEVLADALLFEPGSYTESLKVGFSEDIYSEISFNFTILENRPPEVLDNIGYVILEGIGDRYALDLKDCFSDPDSETLTYHTSALNDIVKMSMDGTRLYIDSKMLGETVVTVRASDARGAFAEQSFRLLVYDDAEPLALAPNIVEDMLYISKGPRRTMEVKLFSPSGALLYSGSVTGDFFVPATLDMRKCAPGRYSLRVTLGDKVFNEVVIKK